MTGRDVATRGIVSHARAGHAREALPDLLRLAGQTSTAPEEAWRAAAAAIEVLFWLDRFVEAADLAEDVVAALAGAGSAVERQDVPFTDALVAAQVHAGIPAEPRLHRLTGLLPGNSVLGRHFAWLAKRLSTTPDAERLISGHRGWGDAEGELDPATTALLNQEVTTLTVAQRRVVWNGLVTANAATIARRYWAMSAATPPTWDAAAWLAGWLAHEGAVEPASRLLVDALPTWWPYAGWDCLPTGPVLQPVLRQAVSENVRLHFLSTPVGPEAEPESTKERL